MPQQSYWVFMLPWYSHQVVIFNLMLNSLDKLKKLQGIKNGPLK